MGRLRHYGRKATRLFCGKTIGLVRKLPGRMFEKSLIKQSERNKKKIHSRLREVQKLKAELEEKLRETEGIDRLQELQTPQRQEFLSNLRGKIYEWLLGRESVGRGARLQDPQIGALQLNAFMDYLATRLAKLENREGDSPGLAAKKREILDEINSIMYERAFRSISSMWGQSSGYIKTHPEIFELYEKHGPKVTDAFDEYIESRGNDEAEEEESTDFLWAFSAISGLNGFIKTTPYRSLLKKILQSIIVDKFLRVPKVGETEVRSIKQLHEDLTQRITGMRRTEDEEGINFLFKILFEDSLIELSKHVFEVGLRPEMGIKPWMGKILWDVWTEDIPEIRERCNTAWTKDPEFVEHIINPLFLDKKGNPIDQKEAKWRVLEAWDTLGDLGFDENQRFKSLKKFIQDHDFTQHGATEDLPITQQGSFKRSLLQTIAKKVRHRPATEEPTIRDEETRLPSPGNRGE